MLGGCLYNKAVAAPGVGVADQRSIYRRAQEHFGSHTNRIGAKCMYTLLVQPRPQLAYMCVTVDNGRLDYTLGMGIHMFRKYVFGLAGPQNL